jgi:NAD(P)-dependent dehydrogenase (short-subunit alcohol dehydrogenase family)
LKVLLTFLAFLLGACDPPPVIPPTVRSPSIVSVDAPTPILIGTAIRVVGSLALAGWLGKITPTGFLPSEDQGAFFAELQMPAGASVITTASIQAYDPSAILLDYATTKAGIVAYTKALSKQLLKKGIRANAICPGSVNGPRIDRVIAADVLYEAHHAEALAGVIARTLRPDGTAMVADPCRARAAGFEAACQGRGLSVEKTRARRPHGATDGPRVEIYMITMAGP